MLKVLAVVAILLPAVGVAAPAPCSAVDDRGRTVALEQAARRIITLAPHLTELVFAAGAGGHIVGTVAHSDYPAAALPIARVGDAVQLDVERILVLQPDLVVAWSSGNRPADLQRLEALGLPVYVVEIRRLGDIAVQLEKLARLTGTDAQAHAAAAAFRRRLAELAGTYAERSEVSVFFQVAMQPLYTVNGQHLISQVIEVCGGTNMFASLSALAPVVSLEAVLLGDPEVILTSVDGNDHGAAGRLWRKWSGLRAVQRDNVYAVNPDIVQRPTPRLLEGVAAVCRVLERARAKR